MSELAIETKGLVRRFGRTQALSGLDLRVPRGTVFGLVGPNGAGKTTAFSVLCGFLRPTAGSATVLGLDAGDRPALAGRVGSLPQDAPLPARMTARQALRYWAELGGMSPDDARLAADVALATVGLQKHGHKRGGQLSHGMVKRVALAQALLGDPELLLLDEPTAGLDPRSAHEIKQLIRERRGRATIVVSSHDLAQIEELCDAVAIIDGGRIVQQGRIGEVTGRGELVRLTLADAEAARALAALSSLPFASEAKFDPASRTLQVRVAGEPIEDAVPALLRAALDSGARVVGVASGRRLEERVLELT